MKAWIGGPDGPELTDVAVSTAGPSDVVVRVHASGLNRADLFMAGGGTHGPLGGAGAIIGLEWAGEVTEVGSDVSAFKVGQRIMGSGGSSFAEYAKADSGRVTAIPDGLSYELAAGLPVAIQTMHNALVTEGGLQKGQAVLIHGASSGVGLMGLKIARLLGAGVVIGSARNLARRARLAEFGADLAVDPDSATWVEEIKAATNGAGVDLVVDQISGPGINDLMRAVKIKGRIVNVGRLGGNVAPMDFNLHALRRITYTGVTFRSRSVQEVRDIVTLAAADLAAPLAEGKLNLPIDRTYAFADLIPALAHMEANQHFGKIVLKGTAG
ncbi:MAG: zinc-binding dehydrogenase [Alphaproteobacteria bacterium]